MKSQVGLGRLYPDGHLEDAHDTPKEQSAEPAQDTASPANPPPSELLSVLVHVEKAALNDLLQKSAPP